MVKCIDKNLLEKATKSDLKACQNAHFLDFTAAVPAWGTASSPSYPLRDILLFQMPHERVCVKGEVRVEGGKDGGARWWWGPCVNSACVCRCINY